MSNETAPLPPGAPDSAALVVTPESRQRTEEPQARRPPLAELALGGALLVGDNVGSRLQVPPEVDEALPRTLDVVLRPVAEWDNAAPTPVSAARRLSLGVLLDARHSAGRTGRALYDVADAVVHEVDRVSRPVRHSRPLRPARRLFHRFQQRGEQQIARWMAMGRQEESRSRAVAEASLGHFVQRSVSDLTESEQVQILVQQVVESQSTGLIENFLEEFRERMVSLDIKIAERARPSATPAVPPFRAAYLRGRSFPAAVPPAEQTLAGHYAGFASRVAALLIDIALVLIALSLATTSINALVSLLSLDAIIGRLTSSLGYGGALAAALAGVMGLLFVAVYSIVGWSINGQTVGNLVMGIRVVRIDGSRITPGRAAARMLGAYVSGLLLFVGFIWIIFDPWRQGWHDKPVGSVVIYDWPAVADEGSSVFRPRGGG